MPLFVKHFTSELFNLANGSSFNNETGVLVSPCAESDLLYQTYLPKPCFLISISTMVNLAVVYANIQGGMTSKHVEGCMNTGPLVLWLSEQHKKPGCLQELRRQEALQCLVLKEKMCLSMG